MRVMEHIGVQLRAIHEVRRDWQVSRRRGFPFFGCLTEAVFAYNEAIKLEALPDELGITWGADDGYTVPEPHTAPTDGAVLHYTYNYVAPNGEVRAMDATADKLYPCPTCEEHGEIEPCTDCQYGAAGDTVNAPCDGCAVVGFQDRCRHCVPTSGISYDSDLARESEVYGVVGLPIDAPMPYPSHEHMATLNSARTACGHEPHERRTYEKYYGVLLGASDHRDYGDENDAAQLDHFEVPSRAHYDSLRTHLAKRGCEEIAYDEYVRAFGAFEAAIPDVPSRADMERRNARRINAGMPAHSESAYQDIYGAFPADPPYDRSGTFFAPPPCVTDGYEHTVPHLAPGLSDAQCMALQMISHALMSKDNGLLRWCYPAVADENERRCVANEAAARVHVIAESLVTTPQS